MFLLRLLLTVTASLSVPLAPLLAPIATALKPLLLPFLGNGFIAHTASLLWGTIKGACLKVELHINAGLVFLGLRPNGIPKKPTFTVEPSPGAERGSPVEAPKAPCKPELQHVSRAPMPWPVPDYKSLTVKRKLALEAGTTQHREWPLPGTLYSPAMQGKLDRQAAQRTAPTLPERVGGLEAARVVARQSALKAAWLEAKRNAEKAAAQSQSQPPKPRIYQSPKQGHKI
jgi:hypothetical protein